MPWKEETTMSLRREFVTLASVEGASILTLCRRFGISRKTGYKWLRRFQKDGLEALQDRSRRPHSSPNRTSEEVEQAVLAIRDQHETWGPRKIKARLPKEQCSKSPAVSTIEAILQRNGRIAPQESSKHKAWHRFEAEKPNFLWQMDFKGHVPLIAGGRCHPLTILDDHSRFLLALKACSNETGETVQSHLISTFRLYGLPHRMIVDNGPPWGVDAEHRHTSLTAWLIRLGISVGHSRPWHPQTQGKDERLHRTLKAELLNRTILRDIPDSQNHFDPWRDYYNFERPHEALGMDTPSSRYRPSPQEFPEILPPIEYAPDYIVRKVQSGGELQFKGRIFKVGKAFQGYPVGIHPTTTDGLYEVFFCHQRIAKINLIEDNHID